MLVLAPLLTWIAEKHRALRRFSGYRWAIATGAFGPLALLALVLFGPPSTVRGWPAEAQDALAGLSGGVWRLAVAAWVAALATPAVWLRPSWLARATRMAAATLVVVAVSAGLSDLAWAMSLLAKLPAAGLLRVCAVAAWGTLPPLVVGAIPLLYAAVRERVGMIPELRRWFRTGMAPSGGWMGSARLKKYTRPLPKNEP